MMLHVIYKHAILNSPLSFRGCGSGLPSHLSIIVPHSQLVGLHSRINRACSHSYRASYLIPDAQFKNDGNGDPSITPGSCSTLARIEF